MPTKKLLRESTHSAESRLAAIVEFSDDAIYSKSVAGTIESWNAAAERLFGYSAEEIIGQPASILAPKDRGGEFASVIERLQRGEQVPRFETVRLRKDGTPIDMALRVSPIKDARGRLIAASINARDISEQKRGQADLRESESRFRQLAEHIREVFWINDPRGPEMLYISPAYEEIWGRSCQSLYDSPLSYLDAVHPDDRHIAVEMMETQNSGEETSVEYRVVRPDGSIRWIWDRGFPIKDSGGAVVRVVGIAEDISSLKEREEALRESELRFRQLADNVHEIFWVGDANVSELLYVSPAYEAIWGRPSQSLYDNPMSFLEAVHPDDLPRVNAMLEAMRRGESTSIEYRILRPDGSQRWIWDRSFPVRDAGGRVVRIAGISEDITDRKLAEEAVQTEQRLLKQLFETQEHERRMVAYDIHDGIVQYAAASLLHLEAYRHKLGPGEAPADLEIIEHLLRKTVGEARRLMTSVRPPVLDEFGLIPAIEHLAAEQQQADIVVEFRPEPGLGRLAGGLEAILYRIAQEALTNAAKHSRAKKVEISLGQHDDRVRLEVRDSGIGFRPDEIGKESRGLQGIRERVRLAGGTTAIDSHPDRGTRLTVELPLTRPLA